MVRLPFRYQAGRPGEDRLCPEHNRPVDHLAAECGNRTVSCRRDDPVSTLNIGFGGAEPLVGRSNLTGMDAQLAGEAHPGCSLQVRAEDGLVREVGGNSVDWSSASGGGDGEDER